MTDTESLAEQANNVAHAVKSLELAVKDLITVLKEISSKLGGPNESRPAQ